MYNVYLIHSGDCSCDKSGAHYILVMYLSYMVFFLVFHRARSMRMKAKKPKEGPEKDGAGSPGGDDETTTQVSKDTPAASPARRYGLRPRVPSKKAG